MAIILNSTVLEESSQFAECCCYKQKKTSHQVLSFFAITEVNTDICRGGKNSLLTKGPVNKRHSCQLLITTSHIYRAIVIIETLEH